MCVSTVLSASRVVLEPAFEIIKKYKKHLRGSDLADYIGYANATGVLLPSIEVCSNLLSFLKLYCE